MLIGELRQKLLGRISSSAFEIPLGVALNADLLISRPHRVGYVGFIGRGNLGDDVILELYRRWCPGINFRHLPEPLTPRILGSLRRLNPGQVIGAALIGGGTIIGQASFRPLVENLLKVFPDVPIFAIGVGVEDQRSLHSPNNEGDLARWEPLLERFKAISVRGPLSRATLETVGIRAPVVGDTALLAANYRPKVCIQRKLLGMNIDYTPYPATEGAREVVQILMDLAKVREASDWRIRCFLFNQGERARIGGTLERLARQHRIELVSDRIGLDRLLARIAECSVFVGHRLHSVVLATAMGVPTVAVEYLPKCRDFQASLGRERYSMPTSDLSRDGLTDMVDHLVANRDAESRQIDLAVRRRLRDLEEQVAAIGALLE